MFLLIQHRRAFLSAGDVGKISAAAHFLAMITGSPLVLCIFSSECERSEQ